MEIRIDIDNTICKTEGTDYENAKPDTLNILTANRMFDEGHHITYWTSRGVGSGRDLYEMTKNQLDSWGCKYHDLKCDKPVFDLFIDDKAVNTLYDSSPYKLNSYIFKNIPRLDKFYKKKKVCLLGNGASLADHAIDFSQYDTVVGLNRIWMTRYAPNVNVYYNSMSNVEKSNVIRMFTEIQKHEAFQYFVCAPWASGPKLRREMSEKIVITGLKNHMYCKSLPRGVGKKIRKRPLTGISALYHIVMSQPSHVDIFGFDFYENNYVEDLYRYKKHNRYHDIFSNLDFFSKMIRDNRGTLVWHK